jgi:hypothetical protein
MKLDQFKFKKSHRHNVDKEAVLKTNKTNNVSLFVNSKTTTVQKTVNGNLILDIKFLNNAEGKLKLEKFLKNISKKGQ